MLSKDVADDDFSFLRLSDIGHALRQDGISVVYLAIFSKETDESLWVRLAEESSEMIDMDMNMTSYRE